MIQAVKKQFIDNITKDFAFRLALHYYRIAGNESVFNNRTTAEGDSDG